MHRTSEERHKQHHQTSEFCRRIPVHDLPSAGRTFEIEANVEERRALSRRYGIEAVNRLQAYGTLKPEADGRCVRLEGRLSADVVQTCVVTLDPIEALIEVWFARLYSADATDVWQDGLADAAQADIGDGEAFIEASSELYAEPLTGDSLDVGDALAEQLAIELDPYPRKPGAVFTGCDCEVPDTTPSPLEHLANWRKGRG
ncbi:MAG: DUF177 domain-containing protein [Rhodospirillales bacterium]|nr:DUF177 domain-containing protein [Rhodospirillales bacterium]